MYQADGSNIPSFAEGLAIRSDTGEGVSRMKGYRGQSASSVDIKALDEESGRGLKDGVSVNRMDEMRRTWFP